MNYQKTIAIIGAGNVGGTLAARWAGAGHSIILGLRNPGNDKAAEAVRAAGGQTRAAAVADAAAAAEIIVLATPWDGTRSAIEAAGNLDGKIILDATNPIGLGAELGKGLLIGHSTSAAEQIASWAPGARVVKALNSTGAVNMANPVFGQQKSVMFFCGDDVSAKAIVASLIEELGFEAADAGPLTSARYLEPLAMLWIHMAFAQGWGPTFAFHVLRR